MRFFATTWVLHEDNHLLVLDKPPGLLTQDSGSGRENLEDLARAWIRVRDDKPGNVYLHAVHRLDRVASGIVLFAKTSKALERLTRAVRERSVGKVYRAWVEGEFQGGERELVHGLRRADYRSEIVRVGTSGAKEARLRLRVVSRFAGSTELEIDLLTGRHHQIRAQLAAIGHPIVGDATYGATRPREDAIALHHMRLTITHPVRRELMVFEAERPSWWLDDSERDR